MELFLNLCWLSLLLPAYLLWRRRSSRTNRSTPAAHPLVFLCVLGCAIVLLFPVISASDDLHAMRAEMEESSTSKRGVCQAAGERASVWNGRCENLPAVVATSASFGLAHERWQEILTLRLALPTAPSILRASRAPPYSRLA
ncbi:MAG: hypothetical protein ABSB87_07295 [Terriglobales bacterium]|jgi:hypothetical protein